MPRWSPRTKAELSLLFATFLWGGTFPIVKAGLPDVSPLLLVALRFSIASVLFVLFAPGSLLIPDRETFIRGTRLGLFLFLGFAAQTVGMLYTTPSRSAFITGTLVVFTPLFQVFFDRRNFQRGNLLGIGVVTVGLWLLTSPQTEGLNRGDLLTLLCAVFFAYYIVDLNRVTRGTDVRQVTFLQMATCALTAWLALPLLETPLFHRTLAAYEVLAYTSLFATLITTSIQTRFQRETSPTRAAIIFTLEPVWASVLSYVTLGERLTVTGLAGGILILTGVLFSELSDAFG